MKMRFKEKKVACRRPARPEVGSRWKKAKDEHGFHSRSISVLGQFYRGMREYRKQSDRNSESEENDRTGMRILEKMAEMPLWE